jgi:hypothetical protein
MFQLGRVEILGTASGAPRALRIGVIPIDPLGERLPRFGCTDQRDLNTLRVNRVARKSAWFMRHDGDCANVAMVARDPGVRR